MLYISLTITRQFGGLKHFKSTDNVQNQAIRYSLGDHAPLTAIVGDMGWLLCRHRCWISMVQYRYRLLTMGDDRLTKQVFLEDYRLYNNN